MTSTKTVLDKVVEIAKRSPDTVASIGQYFDEKDYSRPHCIIGHAISELGLKFNPSSSSRYSITANYAELKELKEEGLLPFTLDDNDTDDMNMFRVLCSIQEKQDNLMNWGESVARTFEENNLSMKQIAPDTTE